MMDMQAISKGAQSPRTKDVASLKGEEGPQASITKGESASKLESTHSPQNDIKTKVSVQKPVEQPVAHRTRSRTKAAENDVVAAIVSDLLAAPVPSHG